MCSPGEDGWDGGLEPLVDRSLVTLQLDYTELLGASTSGRTSEWLTRELVKLQRRAGDERRRVEKGVDLE